MKAGKGRVYVVYFLEGGVKKRVPVIPGYCCNRFGVLPRMVMFCLRLRQFLLGIAF